MIDTTIGVIIDDTSINDGTYEAACSSYRVASGGGDSGWTYQWDTDFGGFWESQNTGDDYYDHIEINDGHNGVKIACQKSDVGFTIDTDADKIRAVSTDADRKAFSIIWNSENIPSSSRDDITDATALGIPEFSTIMMPVASVLLIVGNRIRNKKNIQQ